MCWIMRRLSSLYQFPRRALPKIFSAQFYQREGTQIKPWSYLSISITILGINTRNRRARDSTTRWLHALQAPAEKPRGEKQIWNTLGYLGPCKSILLLGVPGYTNILLFTICLGAGVSHSSKQSQIMARSDMIWNEPDKTSRNNSRSRSVISFCLIGKFPHFSLLSLHWVWSYWIPRRFQVETLSLLFLASLSWPGCGECPVPVAA